MISWRTKFISGALTGLLWATTACAAPWEFGKPVSVAGPKKGVFHHLEAAGRRSIAVSSGTVAITWEDNRDGVPRAYAAFHLPGLQGLAEQRLSGSHAAYEPVVAALPDGKFLFGWEEESAVWVRSGGPDGLGAPLRLSHSDASQITLAAGEAGIFAAWAERTGEHTAIRLARLSPGRAGATPTVATVAGPPEQDQFYPAVVVLKSAIVVAWEDRRAGHTVLLYANTRDGQKFSTPQILNEQLQRRSQVFGRGTGAARVVLTRLDAERAAAAWLDKREFEGGYDVYAAVSDRDGAHFGRNEKVQDDFGNNIGQWHATIAGHAADLLAVAWDDDRDGNPDIWLSWHQANGWSGDLAVPGAAGPGPDTSPAITMDEDGNLFLVWVAQQSADSPTQLRFLEGKRRMSPAPPVPGLH